MSILTIFIFMKRLNKKSIRNRRKSIAEDEEFVDNILTNEKKKMKEIIPRVQHRLGVSREEAKNIIHKLELL